VFIHPDVCEGCGDCGVQSNCVSILPLDTEFGRKRVIDQSSCNKDFSCLEGFCPSFVTLEGARPRKAARAEVALPDLPAPKLPAIDATWNIVVTGIGGTGVVTVGALFGMAANMEGKGAGVMEMAGLAQKGGAVSIHCRIAERPGDIAAIRVAVGEADALIGGDLVVSAGARTLGLMTRGCTGAVLNFHETPTGDFSRDRSFRLPTDRMMLALRARLGDDALRMLDATRMAEKLVGDAVYANVMMLGAAWQAGLVPLGADALMRAIEINGVGVDGNKLAFALGRWGVARPGEAAAAVEPVAPPAEGLEAVVARRAEHLEKYQDAALAGAYRARIAAAREVDEDLAMAMAKGYHKLLAYKDEYEVARLYSDGRFERLLAEQFEDGGSLQFHLAPPLFARRDPVTGVLRKKAYGPWVMTVFRHLARWKRLRGAPWDPFGYTAERRMERRLIGDYEATVEELLSGLSRDNHRLAREIGSLPETMRGFGHIKAGNIQAAKSREAQLLEAFRSPSPTASAAE
jgi:indolepyruvate ferredoxin oxidoreductase